MRPSVFLAASAAFLALAIPPEVSRAASPTPIGGPSRVLGAPGGEWKTFRLEPFGEVNELAGPFVITAVLGDPLTLEGHRIGGPGSLPFFLPAGAVAKGPDKARLSPGTTVLVSGWVP